MRIVNIINLKGGVGKTTTALEMGYILHQQHGCRVLLADNDPQGNLSKALGCYDPDDICQTARLLGGESIKRIKPYYIEGGYDILTANMSLLNATWKLTERNQSNPFGRYGCLRRAMTDDDHPYDYIIIDNPPDLGINVINALAVADDVIVPTKIDQWALEGLDIIRDQIADIKRVNCRINFAGALITMYRNTPACTAGIEWLRENGYDTFDVMIRYSEKAAESTFSGQSIQDYSPRSAAAVSYRKFVAEYLRRTSQ
ncbi:MAG: ParA family protein [Enterocloster asparagiformis]|nr:ParA family protein [Enterocloster asparagiformis]